MPGDLPPIAWAAIILWAIVIIVAVAYLRHMLRKGSGHEAIAEQVETRRLPDLPDPTTENEAAQFRAITLQAAVVGDLQEITFAQLVEELFGLYDSHGDSFPHPETPELMARAIAWQVIEPSAEGLGEVLSLAQKFQTALQLSYPIESLRANMERTGAERAEALAASA